MSQAIAAAASRQRRRTGASLSSNARSGSVLEGTGVKAGRSQCGNRGPAKDAYAFASECSVNRLERVAGAEVSEERPRGIQVGSWSTRHLRMRNLRIARDSPRIRFDSGSRFFAGGTAFATALSIRINPALTSSFRR
jgi:hypothetical protein